MPEMERKFFTPEIKASADSDKMSFEGYLACFGNVDSYGDVIQKGAFAVSLSEISAEGKTVPVLEQHGGWGIASADYTPLGYFDDLKEDDIGLYVKGVLFSTSRGKDMYALLKEAPKGAMGMSIGYRTVGQKIASEEEYRSTGVRRFLTEVKLLEGSIVTFPANEKARVESVKADAMRWRELEKHFRRNGLSSSEAVKAVSLVKSFGGFPGIAPEPEDSGIKELTEALNAVKDFSQGMDRRAFRESLKGIFSKAL